MNWLVSDLIVAVGSFVFALLSEMRREAKSGFEYDWRCRDWGFPLTIYAMLLIFAGCIGIGTSGAGLIALMVVSAIASRTMGTRMALEVLQLEEEEGLIATLKKGAAMAIKVVAIVSACLVALFCLQSFVFAYFPLPDLGIISSLRFAFDVFASEPVQVWFRLSVISFIASGLGMFSRIWVHREGLDEDLQQAQVSEKRSREREMEDRRDHPWMYVGY
jgi:hypothetical protein